MISAGAAVRFFTRALTATVVLLAGVSGVSILVMVAITCTDVVMRLAGRPIFGAYDLIYITGAVGMACALPYTTALKGHVAIEFFFHKLNRRNRVIVDTIMRAFGIILFSTLAWQSALFGFSLKTRGEVSATLQVPVFWVAWVVSLCCAVMVLVKFYNITHPGKVLIKP